MKDTTRQYANGDITVVWQPDVCIHSRICFTGLPGVFDPRKRPWVAIDGDSTEHIVEQVQKCPSGALSYFRNDEAAGMGGPPDIDAQTLVEVSPNGPLLIYGNITIKDVQGHETRKSKVTALCRCGQSGNKPYCDGSHLKAGFVG